MLAPKDVSQHRTATWPRGLSQSLPTCCYEGSWTPPDPLHGVLALVKLTTLYLFSRRTPDPTPQGATTPGPRSVHPMMIRTPYLALALTTLTLSSDPARGQDQEKQDPQERGLVLRTEGAQEGYTLISPLRSQNAYLLDLDGKVVHTWETELPPGNSVYLLDDGSLLRCGRDEDNPRFHGGGQGGYLQLFSWEGEKLWHFDFSDEQHMHHHDIAPLPNGNVLVIAWEYKSAAEALAAGRSADATGGEDGLWPDMVVEVRPTLPEGGEIVWEWHAWDHLIQENDPSKANFGTVAEKPQRIDVNAGLPPLQRSKAEREKQAKLEAQMRALGYLE